MGPTSALTNGEVQELVYEWFRQITDKVPVEQMLAMLDLNDLEMKFPDATLRNEADFRNWYKIVTGLFFDQVHDVKLLAVDLQGAEANVTLIVNWQARTWKPPAAKSEWQGWYIHQRWHVRWGAQIGKPVVARYIVGQFDPPPTA
jgi:hypothetical protein